MLLNNFWTKQFWFVTNIITYIQLLFELFSQNQWVRPSWTFSPDNRKMLIRYDAVSIFRHSIVASYAVYNIDTGYEQFAPPKSETYNDFLNGIQSGRGHCGKG